MKTNWWETTNVYKILPRSFCDTTGNGFGDLNGIRENITYLKDLGVETIVLNSIFLSPKRDLGNDPANFYQVDFDYGTIDDLKQLIHALHRKDIRIILDFPANQTSDLHQWFENSLHKKNHEKRDWYIWKKGSTGLKKEPPNKWKSLIKNKCWEYDDVSKEWYFFSTFKFQPDLNYANPEVQEYMLNAMKFWLDLGIDGLRIELLFNLFKNFEKDKNEYSFNILNNNGKLLFENLDSNDSETKNQLLKYLEKVHALFSSYEEDKIILGDLPGRVKNVSTYSFVKAPALHHYVVNEFSKLKLDAHNFADFIRSVEKHLPGPKVPAYEFSNIHASRIFSKNGEKEDVQAMIASLQFTLRGIPYIYYGDEISMKNLQPALDNCHDPLKNNYGDFTSLRKDKVLTRDAFRTPMIWDYTPHGGFVPLGSTIPWLPVSSEYRKENVEAHQINKKSIFHIYRSLFKLRKQYPVLSNGAIELLNNNLLERNILSFKRTKDASDLRVLVNFNAEETLVPISLKRKNIIFSSFRGINHFRSDQSNLTMQPYQVIVYAP